MATALITTGFGLVTIGIGLWSIPAACVWAGLCMLVAGILQARRGA